VPDSLVYQGLLEGVDAIQREFDTYGSDEERECLHYVRCQKAGSSSKRFANGVRDEGRRGETLADFFRHKSSRTARLSMAMVLAVRLYTTMCYKCINDPLRDLQRTEPHRFPVTVACIKEAIGRLRAVGANSADAHKPLDLWRGMRDVTAVDDFLLRGGTELSPLSSTTKLEVAVRYSTSHAASTSSVLLKLRTTSFIDRGASIAYLSAFPSEEEVLYPPLCFLRPTGVMEQLRVADAVVTAIEVVPHFGT